MAEISDALFKIIDLFCGAGGFTSGVEDAEVNGKKVAEVVACINHDPLAIKSHAAKGIVTRWINCHTETEFFLIC